MDDYIRRGTKAVEEAVAHDKAHEYERAFSKYLSGLTWFEMAAKHAADDNLRKRIKTKMYEYVYRAEQIKVQLDRDAAAATVPVDVGGGGGSDDAKEKDKMSSVMAGVIVREKPKIRLKDVAGLTEAKQALREAVIVPYKAPQLWGENERSWAGILLYGPPGTGKSFLAKAIAGEADCTFFNLSASTLLSKYVGESEKLVSALFTLARQERPSIVFIDEIESILSARSGGGGGGGGDGGASAHNDRVVTELLIQMDGVDHDNTGVLCLGATNLPWVIDQGARRRLERKIYIPLPDEDARARMLSSLSERIPQSVVDNLAVKTEGYSGADIASLIKDALMAPRRRVMTSNFFRPVGKSGTYVPCAEEDEGAFEMTFDEFEDATTLRNPPLVESDFENALSRIKPSVDPATLARYEEWTRDFGTQ